MENADKKSIVKVDINKAKSNSLIDINKKGSNISDRSPIVLKISETMINAIQSAIYSPDRISMAISEIKVPQYDYRMLLSAAANAFSRISDSYNFTFRAISSFLSSLDFTKYLNDLDEQNKRKIACYLHFDIYPPLLFIDEMLDVELEKQTYFINHIAQFFNSADKLFLAVTHTAVENLKRRISSSNCSFSTIQSIKHKTDIECDILFVDECSTVSNADMAKLLQNISCKFLVLVGDVFQIEAIQFGNWFELAKEFIKAEAIVELNTPYRTQDDGLIAVWNKVRKIEPDIMEHLSRKSLNFPLDESIFEKAHEDEIILSLNYDGIYGINNINRLFQAVNPNPSFEWNSKFYKVNDPIVFSDTGRFNGVLYNNLKGIIRGIQIIDNGGRIFFTIELLGIVLNGLDIFGSGLELIDSDSPNSSMIRFYINKYSSTDEDTEDNSATVPFQVSYAISIHKAQGLEYESVKIVITNEVDEQINHNILYTAMTRTKKHLRLYWSPETENYVVSHLKRKDTKKDINLLRTKL